jgi:hypothetical protein
LIPAAHFDVSMSLSLDSQFDYWRSFDVARDIERAYGMAFPGGQAATAEETSAYAKNLEWQSRNYFLYALTRSNQLEDARQQARIIGRRPTSKPWDDMNMYKQTLRYLGFNVPLDQEASAPSQTIVIMELVPAESSHFPPPAAQESAADTTSSSPSTFSSYSSSAASPPEASVLFHLELDSQETSSLVPVAAAEIV